jgi:glycosyltransferase involved in cell wall biosynthesis
MNEPLLILIPIFNDWRAVALLLQRLDRTLDRHGLRAEVLLVDDASFTSPPLTLTQQQYSALDRVDVIALRRNLGHQRAIAVGLAYVEQHRPCRALAIMDGDGEDDPEDVPRLLVQLEAKENPHVVFSERTRRAEGPIFRAFYSLYRTLHWVLTGIPVRVGNFSIMHSRALERLVAVSELWNYYAAAVFKSRIPYTTIPTRRAQRLDGRSHMNFLALVIHGLSAISGHGEIVGVRLLLGTVVLLTASLLSLLTFIGMKILTHASIPEWAPITGGLLGLLFLQGATLSILIVFFTLSSRSNATFLPVRDYRYFIAETQQLFPAVFSAALPRPKAFNRES